MHPHPLIVPYGLITFGALYVAKPDIFFMWMSRPREDGRRRMMPDQSKMFMRGLGLVLIVVGMIMLMRFT
jgi:hypothetical protein